MALISASLPFTLLSIRKSYSPVRGDILHFQQLGDHRNLGKFIWNGRSLQELDYRDSFFADTEEGAIPLNFTIGDHFQPDHWISALDNYGRFVPVDFDKYGKEMLDNFVSSSCQTTFTTSGGVFEVLFAPWENYLSRYFYYLHRKKPFDYLSELKESTGEKELLRLLVRKRKRIRLYAKSATTLVLFGENEGQ